MSQLIYDAYRGGVSQDVYGMLNNVALIIATVCGLLYAWKLGVPFWKVLVIFAAVYVGQSVVLGVIWEELKDLKDAGFLGMHTVTNSVVRIFAIRPLFVLILAPILRLRRRLVCDAIMPFSLLHVALAQVPCLFTGCCRGYACSWGVYVAQIDAYCFPVPILETVLSLTVFSFLLYRTVKRKFVFDGKLYPLMLALFGALRFLCEMLRDNQKILLGCSGVGIHAALLIVVGIVWLLVERTIEKPKVEK